MEGADVRDRLLAYRADRGWSQARLAEESGVSETTIAHIETGANKRPRRITLMRLAQAFGVTLDEFLSDGLPKAPRSQDVPPLRLKEMYVADAEERLRALEAASEEERERYVASTERVISDVLASMQEEGDWADIAADASKSEGERRVAREQLARIWGHIDRLARLRTEATGEDEEPPREELARFIATHVGVGAGAA